MSHTISEYGKQCVEELQKDNNKYIIDYKETLDHDGYDSYGPKSDLWDLFVLYTSKISGEYTVDHVDWFHWENWYVNDLKKGYVLYYTFNMNKVRDTPESSRKIIENKIMKMFGYHN